MLAAAALFASTSVAATPAPRAVLPTCGDSWFGGLVEPRAWDDGCTEQTDLTHARWWNWGGAVATAEGRIQYSPDVVRFPIVVYPVRAIAWRIRRCADSRHRFDPYYTRVRLTFTLRHPDYLFPSRHAIQTDDLLCRRR